MTEAIYHGDLNVAKATQVDDKEDLFIVEARIVHVMTPMEMADTDHLVGGATLKGEVQTNEFRDAWAAILFLLQFVCVVCVAIAYFPYFGQSDNNSTSTSSVKETTDDIVDVISRDKSGVMMLTSYVIAGFTTIGALSFMMRYPELIVKASFLFYPIVWVAVALVFVATGDDTSIVFICMAFAICALSICRWFLFKKQVPFAAAILRCALTALRLNPATYALSLVIAIIHAVTISIFFIAITGILSKAESAGQELCSKLYTDDTVVYATGQMCYTNPPNALLVIGLVFACFWTQQVIENIMHVTTAGVVGSWWFNAMADPSYCSPTLTSSLTRSLTYSFGSICFGSLLVAIIQTLERARYSRNGRLIDCLLQVRSFQFSKWMVCALCAHPYYDTGSV